MGSGVSSVREISLHEVYRYIHFDLIIVIIILYSHSHASRDDCWLVIDSCIYDVTRLVVPLIV